VSDSRYDRCAVLLDAEHRVTGIGSMPHADTEAACDVILEFCSDIPFWPQMVQVDPREAMIAQFAGGIPFVSIDDGGRVTFRSMNEADVTAMYDHMAAGDMEFFGLGADCARGFHLMVERAGDAGCRILKGQVVGPVTFLSSVTDDAGRYLVGDDGYGEITANVLAMKMAWQARVVRAQGLSPVVFLDEPGLAAFGSAAMPLDAGRICRLIDSTLSLARDYEPDMIAGIHCCGNTDWGMILETEIDVVSLDAAEYGGNFILYHKEIRDFLLRGGVIAWGIVSTAVSGREPCRLDDVCSGWLMLRDELVRKGVDADLLSERSVFTPACGLGYLHEDVASRILESTAEAASRLLS